MNYLFERRKPQSKIVQEIWFHIRIYDIVIVHTSTLVSISLFFKIIINFRLYLSWLTLRVTYFGSFGDTQNSGGY